MFSFFSVSSVVFASAVCIPAKGILMLITPSRIASEPMIHFFIFCSLSSIEQSGQVRFKPIYIPLCHIIVLSYVQSLMLHLPHFCTLHRYRKKQSCTDPSGIRVCPSDAAPV